MEIAGIVAEERERCAKIAEAEIRRLKNLLQMSYPDQMAEIERLRGGLEVVAQMQVPSGDEQVAAAIGLAKILLSND